jgi:hypothetical protein
MSFSSELQALMKRCGIAPSVLILSIGGIVVVQETCSPVECRSIYLENAGLAADGLAGQVGSDLSAKADADPFS